MDKINVIVLELQLGQALSTRPDILPTVYCQELARLQVCQGFLSSRLDVTCQILHAL